MTLHPLSILFLCFAFWGHTIDAAESHPHAEALDLSLPFTPSVSSPYLMTTLPTGDHGDCPECPACFNCMLPGFECLHFANCSDYNGKCNCPPGFGGDDCKQPRK